MSNKKLKNNNFQEKLLLFHFKIEKLLKHLFKILTYIFLKDIFNIFLSISIFYVFTLLQIIICFFVRLYILGYQAQDSFVVAIYICATILYRFGLVFLLPPASPIMIVCVYLFVKKTKRSYELGIINNKCIFFIKNYTYFCLFAYTYIVVLAIFSALTLNNRLYNENNLIYFIYYIVIILFIIIFFLKNKEVL